jgi:hypothetical protein
MKILNISFLLLLAGLCTSPSAALFNEEICVDASAVSLFLLAGGESNDVTCADWQNLDTSVAVGDCCGNQFDPDATECSQLCTEVVNGLGDACPVSGQFGNFKEKNEICQILNVQNAMENAVVCEEWQFIIQQEPSAFCIPEFGKFKNTDENCTQTCTDIIGNVPDYCIAEAIEYFEKAPIGKYHSVCTDQVVERIVNKADTCTQWQGLLELSIRSKQGCGAFECTEECETLIDMVESNCDAYVARDFWSTIGCALGGSDSGGSTSPAVPLSTRMPSFLLGVSSMLLLSF